MNEILPNHADLKPVPEKTATPIDLSVEREYNAQHVTELAKTGEYVVSGDRLRILRDLGCAAEQLGSLRLNKGATVISIDGLTCAITAAQKIVDSDGENYTLKQRLEAGKLLGYLANILSKVTSGAVKMDRDVAEVVMEADQRRRQSFQPGQAIVIPSKTANPPTNS